MKTGTYLAPAKTELAGLYFRTAVQIALVGCERGWSPEQLHRLEVRRWTLQRSW